MPFQALIQLREGNPAATAFSGRWACLPAGLVPAKREVRLKKLALILPEREAGRTAVDAELAYFRLMLMAAVVIHGPSLETGSGAGKTPKQLGVGIHGRPAR